MSKLGLGPEDHGGKAARLGGEDKEAGLSLLPRMPTWWLAGLRLVGRFDQLDHAAAATRADRRGAKPTIA